MQILSGTAAPTPSHALPLVVIAASAGGIQALRLILARLPADFSAALLVVQHLEPGRPSRLAEVLGYVCALPVAEAVGGEALVAGRVIVAPPDHHMLVGADGRIELSDAPPVRYSRPSADPLFASVAERCGECAVAVVLTGMDSDGSLGVRAVKARGGTVIVQDPATAREASMPRNAIATGTADEVVPLELIADRIVQSVTPGA
ncbi:MAG TPA: chemotaxis protein CheB [Longimicrobium sp.]|jgi:two-component system chemotaxis response regulator CheB